MRVGGPVVSPATSVGTEPGEAECWAASRPVRVSKLHGSREP